MAIEEAFGQALRQTRRERSLSQEALADISHLDRSYISLLECGRKQPTLLTIFALARALHMTPSELIKVTEELVK